jgi:hypothetical protein
MTFSIDGETAFEIPLASVQQSVIQGKNEVSGARDFVCSCVMGPLCLCDSCLWRSGRTGRIRSAFLRSGNDF